MRNLIAAAAFALGALTTAASSETIPVTDFFTLDNSPFIVSGSLNVVETATPDGGTYTLNNATNLKIWGFGVSNASQGTFVENNSNSICCDSAAILDAFNWASYVIDAFNDLTGQDIFGDISNVLGDGDTHFHWYDNFEIGYGNGSFSGFDFFNGQLASSVIVVGQNGIYGRSSQTSTPPTSAIPLPAGGVLLLAGLGGLALVRRRKV